MEKQVNETLGLFKPPIVEVCVMIAIFTIAFISDHIEKKGKR